LKLTPEQDRIESDESKFDVDTDQPQGWVLFLAQALYGILWAAFCVLVVGMVLFTVGLQLFGVDPSKMLDELLPIVSPIAIGLFCAALFSTVLVKSGQARAGLLIAAIPLIAAVVYVAYTTGISGLFPQKATNIRYLTEAEAIAAVEDGTCKEIADHVYNAPIVAVFVDAQFSDFWNKRVTKEGIEGMVTNDGGNAYWITNSSWQPVDDGSERTQPRIEFKTLSCTF
jgi:hypothetical protein